MVIVSKIPVTFASIMFAPRVLAPVPELAEYYANDLARLRLVARDAAIAIELWIRSRHGTWRFFLVTPSLMVEVDRCGNRIESGQTVAYLEGVAKREKEGGSDPSGRIWGGGVYPLGKNIWWGGVPPP